MSKILLVDDELTMVQMIAEVLRGMGHEVYPFTNLNGVFEALSEKQPDLVITDIGMRGMGGIALAGALHERYPEVAVLIVSMHDNLEYVRQAIRAGARGYVLKDAPGKDIVLAIDTVIASGIYYSAALARQLARPAQAQEPD